MTKGKYYWKFKALIPKIMGEQEQCGICGSKENLNIHHILHCNSYEPKYSDKHNLIVLCRNCHVEYHKKYPQATPVSLLDFMRKKYSEKYDEDITDLKKELRECYDLLNYVLQME